MHLPSRRELSRSDVFVYVILLAARDMACSRAFAFMVSVTPYGFGKRFMRIHGRGAIRMSGVLSEIHKLAGCSVCAVIVSYNPPLEILGNMAALRSQVRSIVVVDNGSSEQNLAMLRDGQSKYDFKLIENGCNLGIAAALNVGVREVKARGCCWAALFDQDSRVEPGFIDLMLDVLEDAPNPLQVGIVCPLYVDRQNGMVLPILRSKEGEILSAMTSGSLIPVKLFDQLGTFNETLFLDYVDIEFCLRSRRAGYRIVQSPRAVLYHSQGRMTLHRLAGRWFASTNHSAARRYYITRNRLWVLGRFFGDWAWSPKEARSMILETIKIVLVEPDRLKKLKNTVLGLADALRGRMGKRFDL
jgi:rhamnosyltransferase